MGCANQCAALAGVSHEEVEFSPVSHKPSGQPFAIGLAALGKLAYDAAALVPVFREPDLSFLLKAYDSLTDLEVFQEARL